MLFRSIGFPRDCGPAGYKPMQWTSLTHPSSKKSFKYSVLKQSSVVDTRLSATTAFTVVNVPEVQRKYSSSKADSAVSMLGAQRGWSAAKDAAGEWLQLDLGSTELVAGVVVQGKEPLPAPGPAYIGCYKDDANRDFKDGPKRYGFKPLTCAAACKDYTYFALQNGGYCSCGDAYATEAKYIKGPDSECNQRFPHGGGPWRNAVFRTNPARGQVGEGSACQTIAVGSSALNSKTYTLPGAFFTVSAKPQIGRASCRERV